MDRKIVMLLIAIAAIGMFALPNTLALYTGQHTFIAAADVVCDSCHGGATDQIKTELTAGGATVHNTLACDGCHGFITSNPNLDDGTMGHAAVGGITCIGCHDESVPFGTDALNGDADGFNVSEELGAGTSAHGQLYLDLGQDACLACHTAAATTGAQIGDNVNVSAPLDLTSRTYS